MWSVRMEGRHLDRLPVRAGQYLNWRFVSPRLLATAHPWSISSAPDGRHLRITVRELGDHSSRLAHLRPGTRVLFEGPYGAFTARQRVRRRVLLLAAGIGVTPVRSILEELVRHGHAGPGDVTVVYRANDESQLALRDELEHLTAVGGHRLLLLVGPPVAGSWLPPDPLASAGRARPRRRAARRARPGAAPPRGLPLRPRRLDEPRPPQPPRGRHPQGPHPRREVLLVRKGTTVLVGLAGIVTLGASWATGLTPKHATATGVHVVSSAKAGTPVAAAPPRPSSGSSRRAARRRPGRRPRPRPRPPARAPSTAPSSTRSTARSRCGSASPARRSPTSTPSS